MFINHINLQYFFTIKKLNQKQTCWAEKLAVFNFYIEYQADKKNSVDRFFRQLNYESADSSHTKLLLMLQNKLTQDWVNSASDQQVTNEMLSQRSLKKQNKIQIQFQKKIQTDIDNHEHLMSWLFIMRATKIKITYNMFAAQLLEIIWQMQRRNIFILQWI